MSQAAGTTRYRVVEGIVLAFFLLLFGRMICLQMVQHDAFLARGLAMWQDREPLPAERGDMLDRHGRSLALSVTTWDVGIVPSQFRDRPREELLHTADRLSQLLDVDPIETRRRLAAAGQRHFYIRTGAVLHRDTLEAVRRLRGNSCDARRDRIYPLGGTAASLLGLYRQGGEDGDLMAGLERGCDHWLRGTPGVALWNRTPTGGPGDSREEIVPAVDGLDLELTLDAELQTIAEDCLREAVMRTEAQGGVVLIVEPRSGDVLAAADTPVARDRTEIDPVLGWDNANFTGAYEPGSVFKLFTGASVLGRGAIDTVMTIDCDDTQFGGYEIHNDMNHEYGVLPFMDAFAHSSNVYFARASLNLAPEEFLDDLHLFGFDRALGVPYPGATKGILAPVSSWERRKLPTLSYGQAIATSPLHLAMAAAAVANGGELMAPRLVRRVLDKRGREVERPDPVVRHRVIDEELSALLRDAMARAVREGTGRKAAVGWTSVGGKTGTAEKVVPGDTTYTPGAYMASFLGFVPAEAPRLVILTMLDQPAYRYHYASESAAPLFREVVEEIGRGTTWLAGLEEPVPSAEPALVLGAVPDVRGLDLDAARAELERLDLTAAADAADGLVVAQQPAPGIPLAAGQTVQLSLSARTEAAGARPCPDLRGLSLRQLRRRLEALGVPVAREGVGYVAHQSPAPGEPLDDRGVRVVLEAAW